MTAIRKTYGNSVKFYHIYRPNLETLSLMTLRLKSFPFQLELVVLCGHSNELHAALALNPFFSLSVIATPTLPVILLLYQLVH